MCPWGTGEEPAERSFLLRTSTENTGEPPPWRLDLFPAGSPQKFARTSVIDPGDPRLSADLDALAKRLAVPRAGLNVVQAFELDLDGDGKPDRLVSVHRPRATGPYELRWGPG